MPASVERLAAMLVSGSQMLTRQDSPGPGSSGVFFKIGIHSQGSHGSGLQSSHPIVVVVVVVVVDDDDDAGAEGTPESMVLVALALLLSGVW